MPALYQTAVSLGYLSGEISPTDAIVQLQDAIGVGELWQQQAPTGHAIFGAVAAGRDALHRLQSEAMYSAVNLAPGSQLYAAVDGALEAIYGAGATLTDSGPARTVYQAPQALPWTWIAAGLGLLGLGFYLFKGKQ